MSKVATLIFAFASILFAGTSAEGLVIPDSVITQDTNRIQPISTPQVCAAPVFHTATLNGVNIEATDEFSVYGLRRGAPFQPLENPLSSGLRNRITGGVLTGVGLLLSSTVLLLGGITNDAVVWTSTVILTGFTTAAVVQLGIGHVRHRRYALWEKRHSRK